MASLVGLKSFVGTIGVISDDDKTSVLLRALMVSDLYRALAEYVDVTAPDFEFTDLMRLARNKNNNNRIQDDGTPRRRQAAYAANSYRKPPKTNEPLEFCSPVVHVATAVTNAM